MGGRSAAPKLGEYTFDTGPTFLMMTYILEQVFNTVGRNIHDYLELFFLDPMYRLQFEDKEVFAYYDKEKMAREINEKYAEGSSGFNRFYKNEQKRYNRLMPCLSRDFSNIFDMLKPDLLKALPYFGINSSLLDVLGSYFKEDKLKLAFTFQAKYLGMSPWDCPGGFTIIPYVEHHFGMNHVKGGLNQICHAMAKVVEEEGGTIRLATPVASMLAAGRMIQGVCLADGSKEQFDYVVMNADFAYAMTNLVNGQKLQKYRPERLAGMDYSCSTFMLYLGLDTIYNLPHLSIIFSSNYEEKREIYFPGPPAAG